MALVGGFAEPLYCFGIVGAETGFALPISQADAFLRISITVLGSAAEPFECFGCVRFYAAASLQEHAKIIFGDWFAAIGGTTQPLGGFRKILSDTFAFEEHYTQSRLCLRHP